MSYRIEEVASSGGTDFAEAYAALDAEFGPRGELERREIVARWVDEPRPAGGHGRGPEPKLSRRYHLLVARDERGELAGVRDCHVIVEAAARIVLVYLAHSLVLPAYRRTGLGARFHTEPIALARHAAKEASLSDDAFDLVLAAEMEPAVPSEPASLVRLVAYGSAGFAAIAPAALPYCQPDFGERAVPRPIPLLAVVRWIGHEGATSFPKRLARAFVLHLHAVFATHVRIEHLAVLRRATLGVLDAVTTDAVPLLPLPRTTGDRAALAHLEREAVLPCFPLEVRAMTETTIPTIPREPTRASMMTAVPGPRSEELRARHGRHQDARTVHVYQDVQKSLGNYLVDVDDNVMLDVYGHIACLPVGYNHPDLLAAWKGGRFDWAAGHRPALGIAPPREWVELVERTMMKIAPRGLTKLVTVTTGSEAVENAIKAAFVRRARVRRGGAAPSPEELVACMNNDQASANAMSVVSFEGGFHGRSLGSLSLTRSKAIHKVDFPAFRWPMVPFPDVRFPLAAHEAANRASEARSLEALEAALKGGEGNVAAVIVEPIQGEGGDRHASADFFREIRRLTRAYDVAFIVDEVQTCGGSTGTFWAHEAWALEDPPDLVTFSKKMQLGGYYSTEEYAAPEPFRIFNTFLGDPLRGAQLEVIVEIIERDALLAGARETGDLLVRELMALCARHEGLLSGARGAGTFAAIDARDPATLLRLLDALRQRGLEVGGSGTRSLRFRPALVFGPRHVAEVVSMLDDACKAVA